MVAWKFISTGENISGVREVFVYYIKIALYHLTKIALNHNAYSQR